MELLVHASTSGHLLMAFLLAVKTVASQDFDVHVIMVTPPIAHLLWAMTIFVRVHEQKVIGIRVIAFASIQCYLFELSIAYFDHVTYSNCPIAYFDQFCYLFELSIAYFDHVTYSKHYSEELSLRVGLICAP